MSILRKLGDRLRFKLTRCDKFPKGDLLSFLRGVKRRGFEPTTIIDVGANCGKWSQKAASIFPKAEFLLVEPQHEMKASLDAFCNGRPHAKWINAGVGDQPGEMPFTVVPDTVSSSFTMSETEAAHSGFERRMVPIVTLDEIASRELDTIPDMVKIDAEGFEARIMSGASKLIGKTEVFLLEAPLIDVPNSEWSSFLELGQMMADYGYEIYDFTSFQRRPYDGATGLCEIAFARRGGMLRQFAGWSAPSQPAVGKAA